MCSTEEDNVVKLRMFSLGDYIISVAKSHYQYG